MTNIWPHYYRGELKNIVWHFLTGHTIDLTALIAACGRSFIGLVFFLIYCVCFVCWIFFLSLKGKEGKGLMCRYDRTSQGTERGRREITSSYCNGNHGHVTRSRSRRVKITRAVGKPKQSTGDRHRRLSCLVPSEDETPGTWNGKGFGRQLNSLPAIPRLPPYSLLSFMPQWVSEPL